MTMLDYAVEALHDLIRAGESEAVADQMRNIVHCINAAEKNELRRRRSLVTYQSQRSIDRSHAADAALEESTE